MFVFSFSSREVSKQLKNNDQIVWNEFAQLSDVIAFTVSYEVMES